MADSGENDVCSVTLTAFEMATTEVTVGLHVADHGLDCRATSEFAFDGAEDAALLTGDEDAARVGGVVAAIALVDIGALDGAAGELLGGIDDAAERMSIIGVARQRLGVEHELATGCAGSSKAPQPAALSLELSDAIFPVWPFTAGKPGGFEIEAGSEPSWEAGPRRPGVRCEQVGNGAKAQIIGLQ